MTKKARTDAEQVELMRNLLAFSLVGAFIWCIPLFVFKVIPDANKDIIVYMVGQLSGMALTALGFYFVNKAGQDAVDAKKADNTNKALETIRTVAQSAGSDTLDAAGAAADATAEAAVEKAHEIKGDI